MMSSQLSLSEPKFPGIFQHFSTLALARRVWQCPAENRNESCDFFWNKASPLRVAFKEGPCELSSSV